MSRFYILALPHVIVRKEKNNFFIYTLNWVLHNKRQIDERIASKWI